MIQLNNIETLGNAVTKGAHGQAVCRDYRFPQVCRDQQIDGRDLHRHLPEARRRKLAHQTSKSIS